jgi:hypothetical protein
MFAKGKKSPRRIKRMAHNQFSYYKATHHRPKHNYLTILKIPLRFCKRFQIISDPNDILNNILSFLIVPKKYRGYNGDRLKNKE